MKVFILTITFIIYNFLFSQKVEKIYDSLSLKLKELVVYKEDKIDYKTIYLNDKIIEKIWYSDDKVKLKIIYTYSNDVLVKRTWYNSKGEITGTSLD